MRIIGSPVEQESGEILLGARDIPVPAIRANLNSALKDLNMILDGISDQMGRGRLAHIDVTLGVGIDGSVGLLGTGVKASTSGGITMHISFDHEKPKA